jgi:hypothetical protein
MIGIGSGSGRTSMPAHIVDRRGDECAYEIAAGQVELRPESAIMPHTHGLDNHFATTTRPALSDGWALKSARRGAGV